MSDPLFDAGDRGATVSSDGLYRYDLWRRWADGPLMGWVMLNPSIGDAELDDHTIRKCMGFAHGHGAAGIVIRNLFAYRTPSPKELRAAALKGLDVVGPENDRWLLELADDRFTARPLVAAWGNGPAGRWDHFAVRVRSVVELFGSRLQRLERSGGPAAPHPARLSYNTPLSPYPRR